jgi:hypothetical protein
MSSKSLAASHHFLPSDEQREEIIRSFMAEHLTVVDQFSAELDMMSARFTHSMRKYISMMELMDQVDAKVNEINSFCDALCPKPSVKTETTSISQES